MALIKQVFSCDTKKQRGITFLVLAVLSAIVSVGFDRCLHLFFLGPVSTGSYSNSGWILFFVSVLLIVSAFIVFRKVSRLDPSYLFFSIALILTMSFSVSYSINTVSWDQGLHYLLAYEETDYSGDVEATSAVVDEIDDNEVRYSLDELRQRETQMNDKAISGDEESFPRHSMSLQARVASFPAALLMEICQLTNMPYTFSYVFPKLVYAFLYSLITFLGMRKLKTGKMLYAAIALLPTSLFLASNYSYDYWINAFSLFGFACLVGAIQSNNQLGPREIAIMLGALVVGFLPKAIYFPLILLCLLIPGKLIGSGTKKEIVLYRVVVCACSLLLFASFAIPMLIGGVGSDTRIYGSAVNATEQIKFILGNPIQYASILATFLISYLSPLNMDSYTSFFAYLGKVNLLAYITLAAFIVLSIIDRDRKMDERLCTVRNIVIAALLFFITVSLVVSSLYITFTPVASVEVLGCQPRYIIPLLFPLLAFIGFPPLLQKMPSVANLRTTKYFNIIVLAVLCSSPLATQWVLYTALIY